MRAHILGYCFVFANLIAAAAGAMEGRVSDTRPVVLEATRQASYDGGQGKPAPSAKGAAHQMKGAARREKRASNLTLAARTADFYIYDAASRLITDRDLDGYYSELEIRFDADDVLGDSRVYAQLYLRRAGESDWLLYHTTDDFWVYGTSEDDDYYVTTTLDAGFATAEYDVLIDVYDSTSDELLATIDPSAAPALALLPLEEAGLDAPIEMAGFIIRGVTTSLLIDDDGDGSYSKFRITFDPDADYDGSYVYAVFWVRPQGGDWIEEHVTADFRVDAVGDLDSYSLTADWISGFPTASYDVQIDLYDAASGLLVASAGSERSELSRIPLEDRSRDRYVNPPASGDNGGSSTSREHGGGAFGIGGALVLLGLALARWRRFHAPRSVSSRTSPTRPAC